MKKITVCSIIALSTFIFSTNSAFSQGESGQAAQHSGQATSHGSKGALHGILATGKITSGASAVPLGVSGAVGAVSGEVSKELMKSASASIGAPLEITEETVTAGPSPKEALKKKKKE